MRDDIEYWKNRAALLEERLWSLESRSLETRCLKEADKAFRPRRRGPWIVRLIRAWWEIVKEWGGGR